MKVSDMRPGDVLAMPGARATVISVIAEHPYYTGDLSLVIWRMRDGSVSFDALSPNQEMTGTWLPLSPGERRWELREALCIGRPYGVTR